MIVIYAEKASLVKAIAAALEAFLERHSEIKVLHFRLDNDEAGRAAVEKYTAKYQARGYEVHSVFSKGKDVNEDLTNQQKQTARKRGV